jgi:hypothetical protein
MWDDSDPPLARQGDPGTSHLAGERLKESGKWQSQKMLVLRWMTNHWIVDERRSLTASELADVSGIRHPVCHKRLPDLRKDGLVCCSVKRECRITGEQAWTWRVTSDEERAAFVVVGGGDGDYEGEHDEN